jgi:lysozyme
MQTSEKGVAFIAALEGVVTRAYRDAGGTWTIGVGHTAAAGAPVPVAGMTITAVEANAILARDLPRYERRVAAAVGDVAQTAFDGAVALISIRARSTGRRGCQRIAAATWRSLGCG